MDLWREQLTPVTTDDLKQRIIRRRTRAREEKNLAEQNYLHRQATTVLRGIGTDVAAPVVSALGKRDLARGMHTVTGVSEEAMQKLDKDTWMPDIIERGARGAARTIPQVALAGKAAGFKGIVGAIGASTYERSYTRAQMLGASHAAATKFAQDQTAVEVGVTSAFQAFAPGLEGMFTKSVGKEVAKAATPGFKQGLIDFSKAVGAEVSEEVVVEAGQLVSEKLSGLDPTDLTVDEVKGLVSETTVATLINMGGGKIVSKALEGNQPVSTEEIQERVQQLQAEREAAEALPDDQVPETPPEPGATTTPPEGEPAPTETVTDESIRGEDEEETDQPAPDESVIPTGEVSETDTRPATTEELDDFLRSRNVPDEEVTGMTREDKEARVQDILRQEATETQPPEAGPTQPTPTETVTDESIRGEDEEETDQPATEATPTPAPAEPEAETQPTEQPPAEPTPTEPRAQVPTEETAPARDLIAQADQIRQDAEAIEDETQWEKEADRAADLEEQAAGQVYDRAAQIVQDSVDDIELPESFLRGELRDIASLSKGRGSFAMMARHTSGQLQDRDATAKQWATALAREWLKQNNLDEAALTNEELSGLSETERTAIVDRFDRLGYQVQDDIAQMLVEQLQPAAPALPKPKPKKKPAKPKAPPKKAATEMTPEEVQAALEKRMREKLAEQEETVDKGKPEQPPVEPKDSRRHVGQKPEDAAKSALDKQRNDLKARIKKQLKDVGIRSAGEDAAMGGRGGGGLRPQLVQDVSQLIALNVQAGINTIEDVMQDFRETFGDDATAQMRPYIQAGWEAASELFEGVQGDVDFDQAFGEVLEKTVDQFKGKPEAVPTYFHSGMQKDPAKIADRYESQQALGIAVTHMNKRGDKYYESTSSQNVIERVARHANNGGRVFLDSGMFGQMSKGEVGAEPDWDAVFEQYQRILDLVEPRNRNNITLVAPDFLVKLGADDPSNPNPGTETVVGDYQRSLELQQEHAERINDFMNQGARVIVPIQRDFTGQETFGSLVSLATDTGIDFNNTNNLLIGVPYNKAPFPDNEIIDYVKAAKGHGGVNKLHLLGGGEARASKLWDKIKAIDPTVELQGDSAADARNASRQQARAQRKQENKNEKPATTEILKAAKLEVKPLDTPVRLYGKDYKYEVTGKTYDQKDTLKGLEGNPAFFYRKTKTWLFTDDPSNALADSLYDSGVGKKPTDDDDSSQDVARVRHREREAARPDERRTRDDYAGTVSEETQTLIAKGEQFGIPPEVVRGQVEDIGAIATAYDSDRPMYVVGSAPGMGKTFVLGGAIRELRARGAKKFVYVTGSQDLISQVKDNLKEYGIDDVEFATYASITKNPPNTRDAVLLMDEAHFTKNTGSNRGAAAKNLVSDCQFCVYATATPFENVAQAAYLEPSGIFDGVTAEYKRGTGKTAETVRLEGFPAWAWMHDAEVMFQQGNPNPIVYWKKRQNSVNAQRMANEWLAKRGVYTQRPMALPTEAVTSSMVAVTSDPEMVKLYEDVVAAYETAIANTSEEGVAMQIMAHGVNLQKRILEAAKLKPAIERAKALIDEGKQVIIFVNTKADRHIGRYRMSEPYRKHHGIKGKAGDTLYTPDQIADRMEEYRREKAAAKAMGDDSIGPAPFAKPIANIAAAMQMHGIDHNMVSVVDELRKSFPKDQVAEYTGRKTQAAAKKELNEWKENKRKLIIATMDKGGTGLSFHDTSGLMPGRVQVNINLPWSGTQVEQVGGRLARLGTAKGVALDWLFSDNIPFEKELSKTVGARISSMTAAVQGERSETGERIQDFDFEHRFAVQNGLADPSPDPVVEPARSASLPVIQPAEQADILAEAERYQQEKDARLDEAGVPTSPEAAQPQDPIEEEAVQRAIDRFNVLRDADPEHADNPHVRVVFERGRIVCQIDDIPKAIKYGRDNPNRKFGEVTSIEPIQDEDFETLDSPFMSVWMFDNHPRRIRYKHRMLLKARLPNKHKPLVTKAKQKNQGQFVEDHGDAAAAIEEATGLDIKEFWRQVRQGPNESKPVKGEPAPIAEPEVPPADMLFPPEPEDVNAEATLADVPVTRVEVASLQVDPDRFQFKTGTSAKGVVEGAELGGEFNPLAAGVVLVWEDKDGNQFAVNGHHRTDLAKRTGTKYLNAQVIRESDGITDLQARALGAELNILEGQGTVDDYAQFFRDSGITEQRAEQSGLLARDKGKTGFMVGKFASDDTWAAYRGNKISAAKAAAIAEIGRTKEGEIDQEFQALGLMKAKDMNADTLRATLNALRTFGPTRKADQGDLFGFDDSAIREAEDIARAANRIIQQKKDRVLAVRGALKRPETAKKMGLTGDLDAIRRQVEEIEQDLERWKSWHTDPDLVKEARVAAGIDQPSDVGIRSAGDQADLGEPGSQPTTSPTTPRKSGRQPAPETPQQQVDQAARQRVIDRTMDTPLVKSSELMTTWSRIFNVPIRFGQFSRRAMGLYKIMPEVVRIKEKHYGNLAVATHEIAHHIDKKTDVSNQMPAEVQQEVKELDYDYLNGNLTLQDARVFEGFAEFVRHLCTEHDAQLIAPQTYNWFVNTWSQQNATNRDLFNKLMTAKEQAVGWADQGTLKQILSQVGPPSETAHMSLREQMDRRAKVVGTAMATAFSNDAAVLQVIQENTPAPPPNKRGEEIPGPMDAYLAYSMSAGTHAARAYNEGIHALTDGRRLGSYSLQSLTDLIQDDADYQLAVAYAYARHTIYMASKAPGYNTGITLEQAQQFMRDVDSKHAGRKSDYEEFSRRIATIRRNTLEMLVDSGALTRTDFNRIVEYYGNYSFPLNRAKPKRFSLPGAAGSQRFVNLPKPLKGRSRGGSGRPILDPIDAMMMDIRQQYNRAAKARVMDSIVKRLDPQYGGAEGMGEWLEAVDPNRRVNQFPILETLDDLVSEGVVEPEDAKAMKIAAKILNPELGGISQANRTWFEERHGLEPGADLVPAAEAEPDAMALCSVWRSDFTPNSEKATVVHVDPAGNKVMYTMDRELWNVATGMHHEQLGPFLTTLRWAAKPFRMGAVTLSTQFGMGNLVRDFFEYQGRAVEAEGMESVSLWTRALGGIVRYEAIRAMNAVRAEDNQIEIEDDLVKLYKETGGALYSQIGYDVDAVGRARRKMFGLHKTGKSKAMIVLNDAWDLSARGIDALQDSIAMFDAPPRIAEMRAFLAKHGYTQGKDGKLRDEDGNIADRIPEHIRVGAVMAASEATINFKRTGRANRILDIFFPFINANIQAHLRQKRQLVDAAHGKGLRRTLVYYSALTSAGIVYAFTRGDDEDYIEQEDWVRFNNWTWGKDGTTYLALPKPRDAAVVSNLGEAFVNLARNNDTAGAGASPGQVLKWDALGRIPTGGGLGRGALEVLCNYDFYRGRPIEPDYMKRLHKSARTSPYTLQISDQIGWYTGGLNLSPVQFQHLVNSYFPGYRRVGETVEAMTPWGKRGLGGKDVPFFGKFWSNRFQAGSIDDFYAMQGQLESQMQENDLYGTDNEDLNAKKVQFNKYAELMGDIRQAEYEGEKDRRRTFMYEPYINGLAREALGRTPLESSPNPLTLPLDDPKMLPAMKQALLDYAKRTCDPPLRLHGLPTKVPKRDEGQKTYQEVRAEWRRETEVKLAYLEANVDLPVIREQLRQTLGDRKFRASLYRKIPRGELTAEQYRADVIWHKEQRERIMALREQVTEKKMTRRFGQPRTE